MKTQKVRLPDGRVTWTVLDKTGLPIKAIYDFLSYCQNLNRSPNTIRAYAHHLQAWWRYLDHAQVTDWQSATPMMLAEFINWLRTTKPYQPSSINAMIAAVVAFYDFQDQHAGRHTRFGTVSHRQQFARGLANSQKPVLPVPKSIPQTLTPSEAKTLIDACHLKRDRFLLTLLYQTGMRIGQVLGLRHQDINAPEYTITVMPRDDNENGVRAKTFNSYTVHIGIGILDCYTRYLVGEYPDGLDSEYVFVILQGEQKGRPLTYDSVRSLFKRLAKRTGIETHPHVFRHTHITELLQAGVNMRVVQERVGHQSIQTTLETYTHLTAEDVRREFQRAGVF
jgi:integrase/recombinase XerD